MKKIKNDLQTMRPELAKEWHEDKNGKLRPTDVSEYSSRKVWWKIEVERFGKIYPLEWQATIANRSHGTGCPYISKPPKRLLKGFNDLAATNPPVARMWNKEKNGNISSDMIFENTEKKYWWIHIIKNGEKEFPHEWEASPKDVKENSCPYCHGSRLLKGFNDLKTVHPEIAEEWNKRKNGNLSPENVMAGSNKKVYWICGKCGHEWAAIINNRSRGMGCPKCACKYGTSFAEQALYFYIKQVFPDASNGNREILNGLELDIYIPDIKAAIEYNGLWAHHGQDRKNSDKRKLQLCKGKNIVLIRICECEQKTDYLPKEHLIKCKVDAKYAYLSFVMNCISKELMSIDALPESIEIDIERDQLTIRSQYLQKIEENSIGRTHPYLMKEWDFDKNGGLSPLCVPQYSAAIVHWRHSVEKDGHIFWHPWTSTVSARANNRGCPICTGKIVQKGYNDLASAMPELIEEWDYEKNIELQPDNVTVHSKKKVYWRHACEDGRDHSWEAAIGARVRGNGCPVCDGKIVQIGYNDIATTNPELMKEWDYKKNRCTPAEISKGYDKKVYWRHDVKVNGNSIEHSWQASPNSRTNSHSGCPYCANKKALAGYNDLATLCPKVAEKWDAERNAPLTASQVTVGSSKKVWWLDRDKMIKIVDRTKYCRK